MGEESTMPPPASKKAAMTARHSVRSSGSSPTLKVIQLPMPTAGTGSPLAGMRLVEIASCGRRFGATGIASASARSGQHRPPCHAHEEPSPLPVAGESRAISSRTESRHLAS